MLKLFYVIIPTLFPYFLVFCCHYILLLSLHLYYMYSLTLTLSIATKIWTSCRISIHFVYTVHWDPNLTTSKVFKMALYHYFKLHSNNKLPVPRGRPWRILFKNQGVMLCSYASDY